MKKSILTKLGLVIVAAFLGMTGCKPESGSSQSESSETSSEPAPLPPEDEHVDLTYPLQESEINEISDAELRQQILNNCGSVEPYEDAKIQLGDYFIDFLRTHNHMTNEEFCYFVKGVASVFRMRGADFLYADGLGGLLYAFAYANPDRLYSTIKEVIDDGTAWGYFVNLLEEYTYNQDYINADYVEDGQSSFHSLAVEEAELLAANPYGASCNATYQQLEQVFDQETGPVVLRFLHRFFRSMYRNLNETEVKFFIYTTFFNDSDKAAEFNVIAHEIERYLLDYVHHVGAWFEELNINADSYVKLYPAINAIYVMRVGDIEDYYTSLIIDTEWWNTFKSVVFDTLNLCNPEGFRVIVKFIGMLASNITQEQLDMFSVEDVEDFDGQLLIDLYNEQYGLLTGDEKANLNDFWSSFNVDFDRFIERLKEAALNPDPEDFKTRGDDEEEEKSIFEIILDEEIFDKIGETFDIGEPQYFCYGKNSSYVLVLKEGQQFTQTNFEDYLTHSEDVPAVGAKPEIFTRGESHGDYYYEISDENYCYPSRRIINTEAFDTSSCGVKEIHFTLHTTVYEDYWSRTSPSHEIQADLTMRYMVVPATIDSLHTFYYETRVRYGDYNNDALSKEVQKDSSGNLFYFDNESLYLVKNKQYAVDDYYLSIDYYEVGKIFDESKNRFVDVFSVYPEFRYETQKVYLGTLDTSVTGIHYASCLVKYFGAQEWGGEYVAFASDKLCMRYIIVDSIEAIPGTDISAPIK